MTTWAWVCPSLLLPSRGLRITHCGFFSSSSLRSAWGRLPGRSAAISPVAVRDQEGTKAEETAQNMANKGPPGGSSFLPTSFCGFVAAPERERFRSLRSRAPPSPNLSKMATCAQ
jgi:hypothetical protein